MKAVKFSEMLVYLYHNAQCHIPNSSTPVTFMSASSVTKKTLEFERRICFSWRKTVNNGNGGHKLQPSSKKYYGKVAYYGKVY